MKKQVLFIHGGETFDTYEDYLKFLREIEVDLEWLTWKRWKHTLQDKLGDDFQVILAQMPCALNAKYIEWAIMFEKYLEKMNGDLILVGHSLGGVFLTKYLSENKVDKSIKGLFLVAACFDDSDADYSLADFNIDPDKIPLLEKTAEHIHFYHSTDDDVVRFTDFEKYKKLLPNATFTTFNDRGHFGVDTFPEIIDDIKNLDKKS